MHGIRVEFLLEFFERADLAGRMPGQRQRQLIPRDAGTVIANPAQLYPRFLEFNFDTRSTGIETVLEQLLEHRSGTFDNLTSGNLIDQVSGQFANRHAGIVSNTADIANHGMQLWPEQPHGKRQVLSTGIRSFWPRRTVSDRSPLADRIRCMLVL